VRAEFFAELMVANVQQTAEKLSGAVQSMFGVTLDE